MSYISRNFPEEIIKKIRNSISHHLKANKKLGQHFLTDTQICDEIALSCGDLGNSTVIEIGPGIGNLTQSILELHKEVSVIAVEKDTRFSMILDEIGEHYGRRLKVFYEDAIEFNFASVISETVTKHRNIYIIANLPYNIGTELIFRFLESNELQNITKINVMLQREVTDRIVAQPNTSSYGWLAIFAQLLCKCEVIIEVPPSAFDPQPNVYSSVISLTPYAEPLYKNDIKKLRMICKTLFMHRRKTIGRLFKKSSNLSYLLNCIDQVGVEGNLRPENLDILTLCKLSLISNSKEK